MFPGQGGFLAAFTARANRNGMAAVAVAQGLNVVYPSLLAFFSSGHSRPEGFTMGRR